MARHEYRIIPVNLLDSEGEKTLNELGGQGWKVIDTRPHPDHKYMAIVLLERTKA